jgi:hypothetical protein
MISTKPVSANAHFSIHDNLDPDSNVTDESDLQQAKQFGANNSIELGMVNGSIFRNTIRRNDFD